MVGVIRKRDIIAHPIVTVRCFGWPVLLKTLLARRQKTFLSLLRESGALAPPAFEVPDVIGDCVTLELRAKGIYEKLTQRFADRPPVKRFFATLAEQEGTHAELLELCRTIASREGWMEEYFAPWRAAVPRLAKQMDEAESFLDEHESLHDALRLVISVEGSEINDVFEGVVAATDSDFVRHLEAFQTAETTHMRYITDQISELAPDLAGECGELEAMYLRFAAKTN
jgi:rubrerythrin